MASTNFFINVKEKGAKKAEQNVKGLNRALGSLKSQAMLAAGAFLGTGALIAGIRTATDAFAEQELAERKLEQALGRTSQALLNQASALQKTSVFGDEATIAQQAFLASLKFSEDQIKTIIPVAMDLASATGMTLESAVRNTAKTFSGLAGELGELVPQLRDLTAEEMKAGKAVEVMAELFGGAAQAETETLTGSLTQMTNAIGDAAEDLGALLSPAIIKSAKFFKGAAEAVGGYLQSLKTLSIEEIQETDNQTLLAERIGKTKQELIDLKQANFSVGSSIDDTTYWTTKQKEEFQALEDKLFALEQQYYRTSLAIVDNGGFFLETSQLIEETSIRRKKADDDLADNILGNLKKVEVKNIDIEAGEKKFAELKKKRKEEQLRQDLRNAVISGQSASDAMKSVVRAEVMEAAAGYFSSVFKTVPFPFNIGLAAGAGGLVAGLADSVLNQIPSFATGGDFTTNGEQLIRVGDNASGRERVQITPLDAGGEPTGGSAGAVNITFNSPIMSADHTEQVIIPQIQEALRRGATL